MSGFGQALGLPSGVVRHTNVAYVKLSKKGKRFEIACYRNKVLNWRNGVEKELGEVLQIDSVFRNASKGMRASKEDLTECFGTADVNVVISEILEKGELQISEQERVAFTESLFRDIASIVVDKTVNSDTHHPFSLTMIENAMREIHFAANTAKSAKSQALETIRQLKKIMPIVKAAMVVRLIFAPQVKESLLHALSLESGVVVVALCKAPSAVQDHIDLSIDPELFRRLSELAKSVPAALGVHDCRLDVLKLRAPPMASAAKDHPMPPAPGAKDDSPPGSPSRRGMGSAAAGADADAGPMAPMATGESIAKHRDEQRMRDLEEAMGGGMGLMTTADFGDDGDRGMPMGIAGGGGAKADKKKKKKEKAKQEELRLQQLRAADGGDDDDDSLDEDDDEEAMIQAAVLASLGVEGGGRQPSRTAVLASTQPLGEMAAARDQPTAQKNCRKKGNRAKRAEKEQRAAAVERATAVEQRVEKGRVREAEARSKEAEADAEAKAGTDDAGADMPPPVPPVQAVAAGVGGASADRKTCNTCGGAFDTASYRLHFKSEWHRTNLKRKMAGLKVIGSEKEHTQLALLGREDE